MEHLNNRLHKFGIPRLASALSVTPQAIYKWLARGVIPAERVLQVEKETGVSRRELRPDLYPEE